MQTYRIPLIKYPFYNTPTIQKALATFVLSTNFYSMGDQCKKFEKKFSEYQNVKHTVLFNSGSSANFALTQALLHLNMLKKRDCMAFSSIGWPTTVMPALQLGLKPAAVDIDSRYLNISLETFKRTVTELKEKYGKSIDVLFYTNILGATGDIDAIKDYCDKSNIILLEDNCESLGSEYKHEKLGNFSLASTFSFFVGHHFSCIEGGAVCTNDQDIADMLIMVRAHGWDRNLREEKQKQLRSAFKIDEFNSKYTFYGLGMNLRPTEITGFLGLEQLPYIDDIVIKRQANYHLFIEAIQNKFDKIHNIYQHPHINVHSNFAFPLVFKKKELCMKIKDVFSNSGIEIRPIIGGDLTSQPFYRKSLHYKIDLKNTKMIVDNGFYFGNNPDISAADLKFITDILSTI